MCAFNVFKLIKIKENTNEKKVCTNGIVLSGMSEWM